MTAQFPASGGATATALDELVLPLGAGNLANLLGAGTLNFAVANRGRGCRVVIPKSGTLHSLSVYMSTSAQSAISSRMRSSACDVLSFDESSR